MSRANILIKVSVSVLLAASVLPAFNPQDTDVAANTPLDQNTFEEFLSLVQSKAPKELDSKGIQLYVDGVTDYIYGYSLLGIAMTERVATTVSDATSTLGRAPINQLAKASNLPDSSYTDVVLPSTTTLYASSFMNLEKEPMVLHLPVIPPVADTGRKRFFIVQLLDGWTNVNRNSPSLRIGSKPGDYLLVGPGGTTESTEGFAGVIHFDTNTVWSILRFFTDGSPGDLKLLNATVVDHLTLTPLSQLHTGYTAPSNLPVNPSIDTFTQPIVQLKNMDACAFFETLSTMMYNNPPRSIDVLVKPSLQRLGLLTPKHPFSCADYSDPVDIQTLNTAIANAKELLSNFDRQSLTKSNWSMPLNVGDYGVNYLLRALVAEKALGANRPQDAIYAYGPFDNQGTSTANLLDGANHYVVHFNPPTGMHKAGEIPPVNPNGFWSITLYGGNGFLVKNVNMNQDSSYNAVGVPYVQNHKLCPNSDGSLDLYVQSDAPSDAKQFCNWLETPLPDGSNATTSKFILFLRMYWPDYAAVARPNGWYPPPIVLQH